MDPVFYAWSKLRRRKYDDTINICTELLHKNPLDQAVWFLKCKAINEKNWLDDTEMEEEGIAEILMDDNAIAQLPRPGTSLARPATATTNQPNQGVRPITSSGRPLTGFVRPGTVGRPTTGSGSIEGAFQGSRPGTSRPVTTSGRFVRLGTASLMTEPGGEFVNVDKLNLSKYAQRPALAKVLFEYLLYTKNNPVKALELASLATTATDYKDWWWKTQIGRCYYKLGLLREAERQFVSSIKTQEMIASYLLLCKVFIRLDQPNTALEYYMKGSETFPGEISLILGSARIYDALNDIPRGVQFYKKVLHFDSSNIEAIACLASNFFYSDQPELALRYYRRLLQMGVNNTELWNNLALCCFYAQQYDMTLSCFERALALAEDDNMADVWYNLGQVAVGIGDMGLAYQCFKIATSVDSGHAESYNNLGVLDMRKSNLEQARSNFHTSATIGPQLHEPLYNTSILMYKLGDFQESYRNASTALRVFPEHEESKDIIKLLRDLFTEK